MRWTLTSDSSAPPSHVRRRDGRRVRSLQYVAWKRPALIGLAFAAAGALAGYRLRPTPSYACDCSPTFWSLALLSVEGSAGAPDDSAYWPARGALNPGASSALVYLGTEQQGLWEIEAHAK